MMLLADKQLSTGNDYARACCDSHLSLPVLIIYLDLKVTLDSTFDSSTPQIRVHAEVDFLKQRCQLHCEREVKTS